MARQRKTVNTFGVEIEVEAHRTQPTAKQYMAACEAFSEAMQPHRNVTRFRTSFYTGTSGTRKNADAFEADFSRAKSHV